MDVGLSYSYSQCISINNFNILYHILSLSADFEGTGVWGNIPSDCILLGLLDNHNLHSSYFEVFVDRQIL